LVEERASASLIAPYRPPSTRVGRYALAGIGGVVVVVAGLWLARRAPEGDKGAGVPAGAATAAPTATAPPTTSQAPPAPPPVEAQQRESAPPAAGVPHASPALPGPAPNVSTPPPAEDAFDLVVASFHTIGRANEVAAAVKSAGEPVRVRAAAGWQQVIAGPYQSRSTGEQAQQRLARAGLTGTRLVSAAR
jgi:cell division protein FtsN